MKELICLAACYIGSMCIVWVAAAFVHRKEGYDAAVRDLTEACLEIDS